MQTFIQRLRSKWLWIAVIPLGLVLFLGFIWFTEGGLKFTLATIPRLFGMQVKQAKARGTFHQGFTLEKVQVDTDTAQLNFSHIEWRWQPKPQKKYTFAVQLVDLGTIFYQPKENKKLPPKPPSSLVLPFTFKVDEIRIKAVYRKGFQEPLIQEVNAAAEYLAQTYQLKLRNMIWLSYLSQGELVLEAKRPFCLKGKVSVYDAKDDTDYYGLIELHNTLLHPEIELKVNHRKLLLQGNIQLSPYATLATRRITQASVVGGHINPKSWFDRLADTDISFALTGQSKRIGNEEVFEGNFELKNAKADYYENGGVPFKTLNLLFKVPEDGTLELLHGHLATIKGGRIDAMGAIQPNGMLELQADVNLGWMHVLKTSFKNTYTGQAKLTGTYLNPILNIDLVSPWHQLKIAAELRSSEKILNIKRLMVSKEDGYFEGTGQFDLGTHSTISLDAKGKNFNLHSVYPRLPEGRINGSLKLESNYFKKNLYLFADINNSQLEGRSFTAKGFVHVDRRGIDDSEFYLHLGDNNLALKGRLREEADRLKFVLQMPHLEQFNLGFSGSAFGVGEMRGNFDHLSTELAVKFKQVRKASLFSIASLNLNLLMGMDLNAPLKLALGIQGLASKKFSLDRAEASISGTLAQHEGGVNFNANLPKQKKLGGQARFRGGFDRKRVWTGQVEQLHLNGILNVLLQKPVRVRASREQLNIGQVNGSLLGGSLHLEHFAWRKNEGVRTKGQIRGIQLAQLQMFFPSIFSSQLVIQGDWDFIYKNNAIGYLHLRRESGDILFSSKKIPLGLTKFDFDGRLANDRIQGNLGIKTRFAEAQAELLLSQIWGKKLSLLPLRGGLTLSSNDIENFKYLLPVGLQLRGKIFSQLRFSGHLADPQVHGVITGTDLEYRDLNNAVYLKHGQLVSHLIGQRWIIDQLHFGGQDGEILVKGALGHSVGGYDIDLDLILDHYLVMNQPNRKFIFSGKTKLTLGENSKINWTGQLRLDKGLYRDLSDRMPKLSDDVHVVGQEKGSSFRPLPFLVDLNVDLNHQLRFILKDLDFLLGGQVRLQAEDKKPLNVKGEVVAISGRYRAYGQNLRVEQGSIIFRGEPSLDNTMLNIRARRYQSAVGAGVDVTGSLRNPRVRLISDVVMSDRDKLSWLVLGRKTRGEEDNEALALSVGILAAEKVNKSTGSLLDNIGLSSLERRNPKTGEKEPTDQMVTLGKQIGDKLYMGYEFGVQSSNQAVRLLYTISQSLSVLLRLGIGSFSGGLRYKIRFD
ncbi:MAG: translocation/assembly module TamB domain-containing protein [Neisseriaceae bacterium]